MLVMEGGVIDQATTDTAAEAAATAEYRPATVSTGDGARHRRDPRQRRVRRGLQGEAVRRRRPLAPSRSSRAGGSPDLPKRAGAARGESAICFVIGLHPHIVSVHYVLTTPKGPLTPWTSSRAPTCASWGQTSTERSTRAEGPRRTSASMRSRRSTRPAHLHERLVLHQDIKPEVRAFISTPDLGGSAAAVSPPARSLFPPRRI